MLRPAICDALAGLISGDDAIVVNLLIELDIFCLI
jgi:hypothetical protein